ncbi:MAG TPA: hypothetical protein VME46_00295, partial [Acidimicrobiales bacterium]|nr:hypothetical protein [Acidimicrobiales bacterium]
MSHHDGCIAEIAYVCRALGIEERAARFDDGFNIGPERAELAWQRWKDQMCDADVVMVSDTAPLARIALAHMDSLPGHLIIWI